jgi:ABC-2 type transport system ATP-binding protein
VTAALRNVTVDYGDRRALDGLSVEVRPGVVTAIVGGDGAGKSTALRCLVGLTAPSGGEVVRPAKERVGYMPSTSGTWRDLTVAEILAFVARTYAMDPEIAAARSARLLERAGLVGVDDRLAGRLSGGMRQKLGFCLAMLHDPSVLVLDEPTTGVDVLSRVQLWRLVAEAATGGAAVLMATTYLDEAERAAEVVVLDDGRPLMSGPPAELVAARAARIGLVSTPSADGTTWRRGMRIRALRSAPGVTDGFAPDLEDVVIAEMIRRRLPGAA